MNMKKLLKPMVIAAAATMAFSATAFAGTSSPYSLNINGKAANGEVLVLVPLRETAEQLGFKVSYNKGTILVDDGIMHTNLTIGENSYQVVTSNPDLVGMSAPFSLSSAPVMTNGKTYVPIELFVPLTGNDSSIIKTDGSTISISKKADTKNEDVQIPNPLTEHETLADLAKTVGFDVTLPTLDKAYKETAFIDISGTTADVRFADDEDTITFRKAKGSDDISGDNKTYKENKTIAVKDVSVSVKGNDGINTATWQKDGFTYSFSSDKAMTQDALVKAIENLF
jgi:hypothetical protein